MGGCGRMWACLQRCVCVCVCVCDAQIFQIMLKTPSSRRPNHEFKCSGAPCCVCVCVCVCVCDAQSFSKSQSVRYHTSPLYSNVRTATMFGRPPPAAFPPSRHDTKTIYSHSVSPTVPCSPICLLRALHRGPLVGKPAIAHGDEVTGMVLGSYKNNVLLARCLPTCLPCSPRPAAV